MKPIFKLILLTAILGVPSTQSAAKEKVARNYISPTVQDIRDNFADLEQAFANKDAARIEQLLTHFAQTAKNDGNLEDLASGYKELTDFFSERGMYEKAQVYFDLSLPIFADLAQKNGDVYEYINQVNAQTEMYQQRGLITEGVQKTVAQLPVIENLLRQSKTDDELNENFNHYENLISTCIHMTLEERKPDSNSLPINNGEPSAKTVRELLNRTIALRKELIGNSRNLKPSMEGGMSAFAFYQAQEVSGFEDLFKYQLELATTQKSPKASTKADALRSLAISYTAQGKIKEAISLYEDIIQLPSNNNSEFASILPAELGKLYHKNNDMEKSKLMFDKTLKQYQQFERLAFAKKQEYVTFTALLHLGNYYVDTNQRSYYKDLFQNSLTKWQQYPVVQAEIMILQAQIEAEHKNFDAAESIASKALKIAGCSIKHEFVCSSLYNQLIRIYSSQNKTNLVNLAYHTYLSWEKTSESSLYNLKLTDYLKWAAKNNYESEALRLAKERLQYRTDGDVVEVEMLQRSLVQPLVTIFKNQGADNPLMKAHEFINHYGSWIQ